MGIRWPRKVRPSFAETILPTGQISWAYPPPMERVRGGRANVFVAEGMFCDFTKFRRLAFYGPTEFGVSRWARHAV